MVTGQPRSAEARSVVDTTCYEVRFDDIDDDLKARLLMNLGRELARRLSKEAQQLQAIGGE